MAEQCDVRGCEKRAAYIVEPGCWLCLEHTRPPNYGTKERADD